MKRKFSVLIIILIIIFPLIFVFSYGCAIQDWINAGQNINDIDPKWDTTVRVPVMQKTIELSEYLLSSVTVDPYTFTIPVLPAVGGEWPLPVDASQDIGGAVPLNVTVDFDGNASNDIDLRGIYNKNMGLQIEIWLKGNSGTTYLIDPNDITLTQIILEGVTYTISNSPTVSGNKLVYKLDNFLSPAEDYYLNFGGDAATNYTQFDIEEFIVELNSGTAVYSGDSPYTLEFNIPMSLGNDYGIAGVINNSATLLEGTDEDIPIDQIPMSNLEGFAFEFLFESRLSFDLSMDILFKGDTTPVPDTHAITVLSGNLTENTKNSYWYASSLRNTEDEFTFAGNVTDYGDLKMDYTVKFPSTSGVILFKTSDYIIVNMDIYIDKATIDL